jgi:hypothetical protein
MRALLIGVIALGWPVLAARAQAPTPVPPGTPVTITVTPGTTPPPPVSITLGPRHGHVTPTRAGCTHTGGGNVDVAQPSPDTLVVTATGVAVACGAPGCPALAALDLDLEQCFEIAFDKPGLKAAKLTVEGRIIGLLRSHCCGKKCGAAEETGGCATVSASGVALVTLCVPAHSVSGGDNLSLNDHDGPVSVPVMPGKYTLHEAWHIAAQHPACVLPCKASSAEFAPDPALDPLWISYWEPFHGAAKKDFGFQITIKVAEDSGGTANGATEPVAPPSPTKQGAVLPPPGNRGLVLGRP